MTIVQRPVVVIRDKPSRLVKVLLAVTACLLAISLLSAIVYLAPTVRNLSEDNATEKDQDACYDLFTADVTDGNASTLSALTRGQAAIGDLVNELAQVPRDQAKVDAAVHRVAVSAAAAIEASKHYDEAIQRRANYVAAGRPLPCKNSPN